MNWLAPLSVIARAILEALFNGLWQGIAVCVAAACLMRLSRRPNAATRYAGWWLALVTVAALPLIELGVRFSPPLAPRGVARSASGAFSPLDVRRSEAARAATLIASARNLPLSAATTDVTAVADSKVTFGYTAPMVSVPVAKSIEARFLSKLPVTTFHL